MIRTNGGPWPKARYATSPFEVVATFTGTLTTDAGFEYLLALASCAHSDVAMIVTDTITVNDRQFRSIESDATSRSNQVYVLGSLLQTPFLGRELW